MVISLSEFNNLSDEDKKKTLKNLKLEVGVSGIVNEWNISRSKAYSMMRGLNISVNTKASRPSKTKMIDESLKDKNNEVGNIQANNNANTATATNPQADESHGTARNPILSQSTVTASRNNSSKFHLYVETQGSASMINETLRMLLESGRLTDFNLKINMTLQEI